MKKLLLTFPIIVLLAVGCNTSSSSVHQNKSQDENQQPLNSLDNSSLQIYTSNDLPFSILYPQGWTATPGAGTQQGVTLTDKAHINNPLVSIAYDGSLVGNAPLSLQKAASYGLSDIKPITISGVQGYKGTFINKAINYTGIEILLPYQGRIYTINYNKSLDSDTQINQIVSSLTFAK